MNSVGLRLTHRCNTRYYSQKPVGNSLEIRTETTSINIKIAPKVHLPHLTESDLLAFRSGSQILQSFFLLPFSFPTRVHSDFNFTSLSF